MKFLRWYFADYYRRWFVFFAVWALASLIIPPHSIAGFWGNAIIAFMFHLAGQIVHDISESKQEIHINLINNGDGHIKFVKDALADDLKKQKPN